jgi:hypothetical protein
MNITSVPRRTSRRRDYAIALSIYLAVIAMFAAPAFPVLGGALVADTSAGSDAYQFLWNIWWMGASLLHGQNPFFTQFVYAPSGTPLVFHALVPFVSTVAALLQPVLGLPLAFNVVALVALPLAGIGGYALAREVTEDHAASLAGGAAFMLCPYLVDKLVPGWLNLMYGALLPFFTLAMLRTTENFGTAIQRRASRTLGVVSLLIVLCDLPTSVFASNIAAGVIVWRIVSVPRADTIRGIARSLLPAMIVTGLYAAITLYYDFRYDLGSPVRYGTMDYIPEPLVYLLPFHLNSLHFPWVSRLQFPAPFRRHDLACYLGLLVFPMCVSGLIFQRTRPIVRFSAAMIVAFLVLSLGPRLLNAREFVEIGGHGIPLPFAAWQWIPLLGAVSQSGRYMLIVYMFFAIGVACFVQRAQRAVAPSQRAWVAAAAVVVISVDFGFRVTPTPLRAPHPVVGSSGLVLASSFYDADAMYSQIFHHRPLVGGYLSRIPGGVAADYRQAPGLRCWFFALAAGPCDWDNLPGALRGLGVSTVHLEGNSWRGAILARLGFRKYYEDARQTVWAVPEPAASGARSASPPSSQ